MTLRFMTYGTARRPKCWRMGYHMRQWRDPGLVGNDCGPHGGRYGHIRQEAQRHAVDMIATAEPVSDVHQIV